MKDNRFLLMNVSETDSKYVRELRNFSSVKAFDSLYEKYSTRVFKFALKYLKSEEDAEEIVQGAFGKIWEKRSMLNPELSFNSYIFTISFNLIKKQFIANSRDNAFKDDLIYHSLAMTDRLDENVNYKLLLEKVNAILQELPPRAKEAYLKKKVYGLSVKEIAQQMGISPKTVENHITSAHKFLVESLSVNALVLLQSVVIPLMKDGYLHWPI